MSQKYILRFGNYLKTFMSEYQLFPPSGKAYLAVSGGLDSMSLLNLFFGFLGNTPIKQIEVIHINHGTRAGNRQEEELVRKRCQELQIRCHITQLKLDGVKINFEAFAREERYFHLKQFLASGDRLYTAHHLDDSFEWKLMQQFKSSKKCLGIPLVNKDIIRPLLCVTRSQLERYAYLTSVEYFHDPTNAHTSHERNFIRLKIVPEIKSRFPKYLKHYAHQANREAFNLRVHHRLKKGEKCNYHVVEDLFGGIVIGKGAGTDSFWGANAIVTEQLEKLSGDNRGVLGQQVEKLIRMVGPEMKGPLFFSGGVFGFTSSDFIYLISQEQLIKRQRVDQISCCDLEQGLASHIPKSDFIQIQWQIDEGIFPHFVFFRIGDYPSLKKSHPLMEQICKKAQELGLGFNTLSKIISLQEKQKLPERMLQMVTQSGLLDYLK